MRWNYKEQPQRRRICAEHFLKLTRVVEASLQATDAHSLDAELTNKRAIVLHAQRRIQIFYLEIPQDINYWTIMYLKSSSMMNTEAFLSDFVNISVGKIYFGE